MKGNFHIVPRCTRPGTYNTRRMSWLHSQIATTRTRVAKYWTFERFRKPSIFDVTMLVWSYLRRNIASPFLNACNVPDANPSIPTRTKTRSMGIFSVHRFPSLIPHDRNALCRCWHIIASGHPRYVPVPRAWQLNFPEWPITITSAWNYARISVRWVGLTTMPRRTFSPPTLSSTASSSTMFRKTYIPRISHHVLWTKMVNRAHHSLEGRRWLSGCRWVGRRAFYQHTIKG